MEIKVEQDDLIRLLKEYITHLGIDISNSDIQVDFMSGRKHPSYAVIKILDPDDEFVSSSAISLATNPTEDISKEDKKEDPLKEVEEVQLNTTPPDSEKALTTTEKSENSPDHKDLNDTEQKPEIKPKSKGRPKGSKNILKKTKEEINSINPDGAGTLGELLDFEDIKKDEALENEDVLETPDKQVAEDSKKEVPPKSLFGT